MFMCYECQNEFDTPKYVQESRGEFWGMPCSETMSYCPFCGSEAFDERDIVMKDLMDEDYDDEEDE